MRGLLQRADGEGWLKDFCVRLIEAKAVEAAVLSPWARNLFGDLRPALAGVGLDPDRVVYAKPRRDRDLLASVEEGLRHGALRVVSE